KSHVSGRIVFRGVKAAEAREPHNASGPATDNEGAERIGYRKRQATEKIVALHLHGLEADLIVDPREFAALPGDAREIVAHFDDEAAAFDMNPSLSTETGWFPSFQTLAVEQALPFTVLRRLPGRLRTRSCRVSCPQDQGQNSTEAHCGIFSLLRVFRRPAF